MEVYIMSENITSQMGLIYETRAERIFVQIVHKTIRMQIDTL